MWLPQQSLWSFREWEWKLGVQKQWRWMVVWIGKWIGEPRLPVLLGLPFSLSISQLRGAGRTVICLAVKLVIAPPSIIGWPAIDRQCTFSFQLNYITKKKKNSKCLLALSGPHFLPASAKALEKKKKWNPETFFRARVWRSAGMSSNSIQRD